MSDESENSYMLDVLDDVLDQIDEDVRESYPLYVEKVRHHSYGIKQLGEHLRQADRYAEINTARYEIEAVSYDGLLLEAAHAAAGASVVEGRKARLHRVAVMALIELLDLTFNAPDDELFEPAGADD